MNEVKPPSHHLNQVLLKQGLSRKQFAIAAGVDPWLAQALCNNKQRILPRIALKLERVLCIKAEEWLRMQADYDLWQIRRWWEFGPRML